MRDLRNELKKKEESAKLSKENKNASGSGGPELLKKSTIVGVLPNDVSKNGEFNTHSYSGEDSAG